MFGMMELEPGVLMRGSTSCHDLRASSTGESDEGQVFDRDSNSASNATAVSGADWLRNMSGSQADSLALSSDPMLSSPRKAFEYIESAAHGLIQVHTAHPDIMSHPEQLNLEDVERRPASDVPGVPDDDYVVHDRLSLSAAVRELKRLAGGSTSSKQLNTSTSRSRAAAVPEVTAQALAT